jgi:hypothetical protein
MDVERWSIDEVSEVTATVLRARMTRSVETLDDAVAARIAAAAASEEAWRDEVDFVLDKDQFQTFLESSLARAGIPHGRPLREGDVYIVYLRGSMPMDAFKRPEDTASFVFAAGAAIAAIQDITAEARRATKAVYGRVVEQLSPKETGR